MPKFLVDLTRTYEYSDCMSVEIEAEDEEEAIKIAREESVYYNNWEDMGEPFLSDLYIEADEII